MQGYNAADQRLHFLSQILARANRTFLPAKEDDSHTNLYFDSLGNRICGRWIETDERQLLFTLNLSTLSYEIIDSAQQVVTTVPAIGRKLSETEVEITKKLPALGLSPEGFSADLHFEIPTYPFADTPVEAINIDNLEQWKQYRTLANTACNLLLDFAQVNAEVRIWPHHFDTGFYTEIHRRLGIGFGLAMEDKMAGAPYFYISGYPTYEHITYKNTPIGEHWKWEISDNWKGAFFPLGDSVKETLPRLKDFIREVFAWYVKAAV